MIENIIYDSFYRLKNARLPNSSGSREVPADQPWSTAEVSCLIDAIIREVNSRLAKEYFTIRKVSE